MKLKLEIFIYEPETESKKEGRKEGYLVEFICSRFNGEKCLSRICGEIRHKTEKSTKKCWGQTLFYYFCLVFSPLWCTIYTNWVKIEIQSFINKAGELGITHSHTDTHRQSELPTQLIYLSTYQQSVRLLLLTRVERAKIYLRQLMLIIILNLNKTIDICRH